MRLGVGSLEGRRHLQPNVSGAATLRLDAIPCGAARMRPRVAEAATLHEFDGGRHRGAHLERARAVQRLHSLRQLLACPPRLGWLVLKPIPVVLQLVAAREAGAGVVHECEASVVERLARHAQVVAVEHAVARAWLGLGQGYTGG